jgi:hypothetical protein
MTPRTTSPIALTLLFVFVATSTIAGCGEKRPKKKKVDLFSKRPEKIDFSQIKVDKPKIEAVKPKSDSWAANTKETVAAIHKDLQQCRNEYMLPFQFKKMRRRNVEWLKLNKMDAVCRDGDAARKKRGAWKRITWLAKEQIGKQPELDQFIAMAADHVEHARMVSLMAKKIGAPKIELITQTAQDARNRVITVGMQLDQVAAKIGNWPNDLEPLDGSKSVASAMDFEGFKTSLQARYVPFISDALGAYDRYASESWQYPNMVKFRSFRLFAEILTRYQQQDQARLDKVTGLNEKTKKQVADYMAGVDGVIKAWNGSYTRYMKDKSGTWTDVDPFRVPIVKARRAWGGAHDKLFGTKLAAAYKAENSAWKKADRKRRRRK